MKKCEKHDGCPPGVDLRFCKDFPNDCPFAHVIGDAIHIERRQLSLFDGEGDTSCSS